MNKNPNISLLDPHQVTLQEHDAHSDAKRVVIVGASGIAESIKEGLKDLKIDIAPAAPQVTQALVPQIITVPEYKIIEVPTTVVIKEIEYRELEKPVIVPEIRVIEVEKPVFIKEIEYREIEKQVIVYEKAEIPTYVKCLLLIHTIANVIISLVHIFK